MVTHGTRRTKLLDCNPASFCSIKKTTQTGLGTSSSQPFEDNDEADESYNPLDDEEDEVDAQNTVPMNTFQTEMRTAFEQLRSTQEIHGMQLTKMVESTHRYADKLAHQRASTDWRHFFSLRKRASNHLPSLWKFHHLNENLQNELFKLPCD
ncbi:hypothetical protein M9H77_23856 [Catharanthus roseus]|uniref:Uncharacterized protein n=2 Tax=Catharanthus roseus TaxID=4058 RepID=A0ACC0AX06_CATRO|nr:hypothetical protein M9H77_23855 [Catharanthus roseus]KAI5664533.1 hypothetical protein M9H77_23856 [Catharanthus roseus]